uniref:Transmembrane protein 214 n=1 Tax=Cairina moschata TaxID=8855 RepID=A0A8C3BPR2_CAIMO
MAAAGGGRWEVVRRGRRPAGGSGGRRAAGEANAGRVPAPARECGAAAGGAGRRWRGRGELWGRGRGPVALSPSPRSPRSSRGRGWRRPRAGPGEGGEEAGPGGGGRAGGAAAARREERQEGGGRRRPQARPVPLAGGSAESARRGGPAEGAGQEPEHVPREPLRLGEGPGRLPQLQAAGAQERPCAQPARPRLSVLSCEQRAEEYHQIPAGKVFQRAGALLRPLHLHHAAGAGQDPRGVPARVQDLHPGGAAGQAQNRHREPGQVWLGVMLPVLGIKALSPYAVAYLDRLLMMHPNLTKGFGMIGPKDFFPLLDFAFMPNNSLSPSLQEQLRRLYPRLKVLALGARPEATLHTYFPSFLSRATPSCPPAMRKELLASMSQCLSVDPLSFSVWRQLYTKHLAQSSLLLNHLLESWDNGSRKVRQSLQETVRSFKVTNEELAARGPGSEQDVAACDAACKVLLQKMKGGGFPWSRLLLIGLVFAVGFLLHDVRTHGSLQASTSARVLRSSGILSASQQAWHKASHYSLEGYSSLQVVGEHPARLLLPGGRCPAARSAAALGEDGGAGAAHLRAVLLAPLLGPGPPALAAGMAPVPGARGRPALRRVRQGAAALPAAELPAAPAGARRCRPAAGLGALPGCLPRRGVVGLPESTADEPHLLLVGLPAEHDPGRHKLGLGHDLRTLSCCPSLGTCWSHRGAAAPSSVAGPWGPRAARHWGALVRGCARP